MRSISVLEEEMNKVKATFESKEQTLVSEKAELENQLKLVDDLCMVPCPLQSAAVCM